MSMPILIVNQNLKRETGKKSQTDIILASKSVSDLVRTTLGPRAMLKMILDPNGNVVLTNDGSSVLREIEVKHPAAKTVIELSRTQDERVGDGTTTVVILAGELMEAMRPFLLDGMHPTRIVNALHLALEDSLAVLKEISVPIDVEDKKALLEIAIQSLQTKFVSRFGDLIPRIALEAVCNVRKKEGGVYRADVKTLVKVEKVAGGTVGDSVVLNGIMLNKDILHSNMRRKICNPRVMLLDSALEYKKAESETNIEITDASHWRKYLELEEAYIRSLCQAITRLKPDVLVTEKGVSDMAQHFLQAAGVSVLRRARKSDLQRLALSSGARIASQPAKMSSADIGTRCALFEVRKIGDEYFSFFEGKSEDGSAASAPGACSVLLRGASKDILSEMERNLQDAMAAVKSVLLRPVKLPGGGAAEAAAAAGLRARAAALGPDVERQAYLAAAKALEVVPRTLVENCGGRVPRVMAALRAAYEGGSKPDQGGNEGNVLDLGSLESYAGVDGKTGEFSKEAPVWDPAAVKEVAFKTAFEAATTLLRIDDVVTGQSKEGSSGGMPGGMPGGM